MERKMALTLTKAATTPPGLHIPTLRGLHVMLSTARQRRHLARLDDHLLRDIGLSRAEAAAEAKRTMWDAPAHWHRSGAGHE
jgi:uncharacterized protein YjiS (DUF1127 family)